MGPSLYVEVPPTRLSASHSLVPLLDLGVGPGGAPSGAESGHGILLVGSSHVCDPELVWNGAVRRSGRSWPLGWKCRARTGFWRPDTAPEISLMFSHWLHVERIVFGTYWIKSWILVKPIFHASVLLSAVATDNSQILPTACVCCSPTLSVGRGCFRRRKWALLGHFPLVPWDPRPSEGEESGQSPLKHGVPDRGRFCPRVVSL